MLPYAPATCYQAFLESLVMVSGLTFCKHLNSIQIDLTYTYFPLLNEMAALPSALKKTLKSNKTTRNTGEKNVRH